MKLSKYTLFGLLLAFAGGFSACQDDYDAPTLENPESTWVANTSIAEFKLMVSDKEAMEIPMKQITDPETGETAEVPYILKGRVISSDVSGNIFKSLVIQDATAAITLSINQASMYTNYRVGQEVYVNATGLWGGKYRDLVCLGAPANDYGTLATSRMTYAQFLEHSQKQGMPTSEMIYVESVQEAPANSPYTILFEDFSFPATMNDDFYLLQSQLVEISNVYFKEAGNGATYTTKEENISRTLIDATGGELAVRLSGKSKFYNTPLPEGKITIRGILSYYTNTTSVAQGWQLLIRDLDDVIYDGSGTKDRPYSVEEAIAEENNGRNVWTFGYIVGSVKAGVQTVTSNDDILFGADTDHLDNNIVIAADKDCTDFTKCMVVALPQDSKLRQFANLADNPEVLGHRFAVVGKLKEWLGMYGITGCPGTITDFMIEGIDLGVVGTGTGTANDPYSVDFILNLDTPLSSAAWVEGYIVGFVEGRDYYTGAVFSGDATGRDYANNNVILALTPDETDPAKCMPARVPTAARTELGLGNNPSAYKRKVAIKGNTGDYLGAFGLATADEYAWK